MSASADDILVLRTIGPELVLVGSITGDRSRGHSFAYAETYLVRRDAVPISLSMPLGERIFAEMAFRPYFEGLLAEGEPRRRLCAEAGIPEDDYLSLLVYCGRDCIGDVVICKTGDVSKLPARHADARFEDVPPEQMMGIFKDSTSVAESNNASRLSLAGTQDKAALTHASEGPWSTGWLRPKGLTPSTHILKTSELRDLPELEYLCMSAARKCGLACAETHLVQFGRPVVVSGRFDRDVLEENDRGITSIARRHQEDFAQALGVTPASKYAELEGGTIAGMARLVRRHSARPLRDLMELARVLLFDYLIGNCDAHLKNFSFVYPEGAGAPVLAPAYDLVSTTYFERFSRQMAMTMGRHGLIDDIDAADVGSLAPALGLGITFLRKEAGRLAQGVTPALLQAANSSEALDGTGFIAEDLVEDMQPRLAVLRRFTEVS